METISRYLTSFVKEDLKDRMVFVGGPRQVGKTTFAQGILGGAGERHPAYLNWDDPASRGMLLKGQLPPNENLIILDEIHKYARWRNLVKGLYDVYRPSVSFLITGSARLDFYSKGGDSLQGRYHYYRLHPFGPAELTAGDQPDMIEHLIQFGGFPEPCLRGDDRFWRRWQRERLQRVIYDDIRDLERIQEISQLELLAEELPHRIGAPLSVKNIAETLQVSFNTADRWIRIFERMYYGFRIAPYGPPKVRAVKKEQKFYLWDWSLVPLPGFRFENFVAALLLKYCHWQEDTQGYRMELRFLRDTDRREVDFVVLKDREPQFAVECKSGEKAVGRQLHYFRERTAIPFFFQVHRGRADFMHQGVRVLPLATLCRELQLP
jgi:predicted AAA+ superfamily ATPase